jgi:Hemerythrin HHE cation binding domain
MQAPTPQAPIQDFQHSHADLSRAVVAIGLALRDGKRTSELVREIDALRDELVTHFSREEEGLFPFLVDRVPSLQGAVDAVRLGHDIVCGAIVRLSHAAALSTGSSAPPSMPPSSNVKAAGESIGALFERFEKHYAEHAQEEGRLLASAAAHLSESDQTELRALLEGL